jgi:hypothetical protein
LYKCALQLGFLQREAKALGAIGVRRECRGSELEEVCGRKVEVHAG